ncbi:hypothetical protein [Bacillus sp. AK031]
MIDGIIWAVVFTGLLIFMFYWDNKKEKHNSPKQQRKIEHEQETEKQIELEKGKGKRPHGF